MKVKASFETKVDKDHCPPFVDGGIAYWERSEDPWHAKAYPKVIRHLAPNVGRRKGGWLAIDGHENPIGFIADGQMVSRSLDEQPVEYMTYVGPFDRPVCVPLAEYSVRTIEQHCKMRKERQRKNLKVVERQIGIISQAKAIAERICKQIKGTKI